MSKQETDETGGNPPDVEVASNPHPAAVASPGPPPLPASLPAPPFLAWLLAIIATGLAAVGLLLPWGVAEVSGDIYLAPGFRMNAVYLLLLLGLLASGIALAVTRFVQERVFLPFASLGALMISILAAVIGFFAIFTTDRLDVVGGMPEEVALALAIDEGFIGAFRRSGMVSGRIADAAVLWPVLVLFWLFASAATFFNWRVARKYAIYSWAKSRVGFAAQQSGKAVSMAAERAGSAAKKASASAADAAARANSNAAAPQQAPQAPVGPQPQPPATHSGPEHGTADDATARS